MEMREVDSPFSETSRYKWIMSLVFYSLRADDN